MTSNRGKVTAFSLPLVGKAGEGVPFHPPPLEEGVGGAVPSAGTFPLGFYCTTQFMPLSVKLDGLALVPE